jgi:RecA/RadA recombinase
MSLLDKLKKNTTIKDSSVLSKSKFFTDKDVIPTDVPMINVALSGRLDGGLVPGLTMLAGPSKHFKTAFALLMASAYQRKYPDAVILFYDSEFGTPQKYFETFNIDMDRVLHTPITDVEQLKHDIVNQLLSIEKNDKVIIVLDSIGNLASRKEVEDATEGKSVADMSRAKQIKSLFRMVTPHLTIKDIPMVVVNHTYKEIGMFPKDIVGGGCVVENTMIQTPKGLRPVQDFVVGDKVLHKSGEIEVSHVWNPNTLEDGNPECYEIEFEDGYKVICSENHKFFIEGKWIKAKDVTINMNCEVI